MRIRNCTGLAALYIVDVLRIMQNKRDVLHIGGVRHVLLVLRSPVTVTLMNCPSLVCVAEDSVIVCASTAMAARRAVTTTGTRSPPLIAVCVRPGTSLSWMKLRVSRFCLWMGLVFETHSNFCGPLARDKHLLQFEIRFR